MTVSETDRIRQRYLRRALTGGDRYSPLQPATLMSLQERERALARWIRTCGIAPIAEKRVLEIGCGSGSNLLQFLRLGFRPQNLVGNDLLPDRLHCARALLPETVELIAGDALALDRPAGAFDVVLQSTVFTSILDAAFQSALADRIWRWTAPGGGVLWYDFLYDNPWNPDVQGIPLRRIRELFPAGHLKYWRLTLAPPLSRWITRIHPSLYSLFNFAPFVRTHVLCWIGKQAPGSASARVC